MSIGKLFITHSPAVSIISVTVTIIPNDTLYVDTFSDFMCSATISEYVDTPTTIMYQWLGPSLLTIGADYNITGDTLRINRFNMMRDNGRTITCRATVLPASGQQYVLQDSASADEQLTVEGKYCSLYAYIHALMFVHSTQQCTFHSSCHYSWSIYRWRQLQHYLQTGWSSRKIGSDTNSLLVIQ